MKLLFTFLTLVSGFAATPALANQPHIICEEDRRPTDGDYSKLEIRFISENRANITFTAVAGGHRPSHPNQPKNGSVVVTDLGKNILCKQGPARSILLSCFRDGQNSPTLLLQQKNYYGQDFVELTNEGRLSGLFELRSCRLQR